MMIEIKNINKETFKPYGIVIEFSENPEDPRFEIVQTEAKEPWRIAVFRVKDKGCDTLECHKTSLESFEPVSGVGILIVAPPDAPEKQEVFLLDKSVCLHKGTWHQLISLSEETIVKIVENLEVTSEFYHLPKQVTVGLV